MQKGQIKLQVMVEIHLYRYQSILLQLYLEILSKLKLFWFARNLEKLKGLSHIDRESQYVANQVQCKCSQPGEADNRLATLTYLDGNMIIAVSQTLNCSVTNSISNSKSI